MKILNQLKLFNWQKVLYKSTINRKTGYIENKNFYVLITLN